MKFCQGYVQWSKFSNEQNLVFLKIFLCIDKNYIPLVAFQISIFYGARSNAELLVHNGFVYPENDMDRTAIKLGIIHGITKLKTSTIFSA